MAWGGKRGRPKQIQPESSSTPERPVSREEDIIKATPKRCTVSSYASLVNPDEGTSLQFVEASTINGIKYAKIETEDIAPEVEYWQSIILCSVLGVNPPLETNLEILPIDKICLVKRGVFLVRFAYLDDQLSFVQKGVYYVDHKPLLVKAWNP
ncbi:hypothetical protein Cgig2_030550 [Carnegiea gigantea]|uniref:DUF4283 domain-containing protein n=1 Tax=Carnegiea gigantea TaxID=171969 RepID=A0A9Q1JFL1_9CARY|nr:hypothetical protein Cgig2_030550 [Carnegiea gigantea]